MDFLVLSLQGLFYSIFGAGMRVTDSYSYLVDISILIVVVYYFVNFVRDLITRE